MTAVAPTMTFTQPQEQIAPAMSYAPPIIYEAPPARASAMAAPQIFQGQGSISTPSVIYPAPPVPAATYASDYTNYAPMMATPYAAPAMVHEQPTVGTAAAPQYYAQPSMSMAYAATPTGIYQPPTIQATNYVGQEAACVAPSISNPVAMTMPQYTAAVQPVTMYSAQPSAAYITPATANMMQPASTY